MPLPVGVHPLSLILVLPSVLNAVSLILFIRLPPLFIATDLNPDMSITSMYGKVSEKKDM